MSRSGYTEDCDDNLAAGRWLGAVKMAMTGRRGQAMLRELLEALDAMPDKRLFDGNFATAEGEFCTLGVLGAKRGTKMDDLGDDYDGCDRDRVGARFGIAGVMAAEIMYMNDEYAADKFKYVDIIICGPMRPHLRHWERHERCVQVLNENHPQERWLAMRKWVSEQIIEK